MQVIGNMRELYEVQPVQKVIDDCVISKMGDVTVGWELDFPSVYTVSEAGYDEMVGAFVQAARLLPDWTMIHRQDIYTFDTFHGTNPNNDVMRGWFMAYHDGRRFLRHKSYLFLTSAAKGAALRSNGRTSAFGIRFTADLPSRAELVQFANKASEFIAVFCSSGYVQARRLTDADFEGEGDEPGLIDRYLMLQDGSNLKSDMVFSPEKVQVYGKELVGFRLCEAEELPLEVSNTSRVRDYGDAVRLFMSSSAPLGIRLDCDHVVNQYILIPNQQKVLQELDGKRRRMVSMSKNVDNELNAKQIDEFIRMARSESATVCYSHMNVLAWDTQDKILALTDKVSSALSTMGCVATQSLSELPSLFMAGCPGGECEIGKDNLMCQELTSMLCMGLYETFDRSIKGGTVVLGDRFRRVPIELDFGLAAQKMRLINNYNVFLLGPSGAGKSFFTNFFLRQGYENGEHQTLIDQGDSYYGLCSIINEISGGKDGVYLSWTPEHPFSFNPFVGIREWLEGGRLRLDEGGASFFLSFLKTAWDPDGGWTSARINILDRIVTDFVRRYVESDRTDLPLFDEFYCYLRDEVKVRIVPVLNDKGEVERLPVNPLVVGDNPVTPARFDISDFMQALVPYSLDGSYSFLLNDPAPKDLFSSRFTVFEVRKLSDGDPLFYSLCVLCIMNAFDRKMHTTSGFKRLVVDEAWKAISNKTMEPYLRGLWKTARKYQCSAMVITQELDDIRRSDVIRDTILVNSDIRVLLDQSKNENRFDEIVSLMGLTEQQRNLVLSMGKKFDPHYREVYVSFLSRYGVYLVEASPEEGLAYESEYEKKRPVLELAKETGSMVSAIERFVENRTSRKRR